MCRALGSPRSLPGLAEDHQPMFSCGRLSPPPPFKGWGFGLGLTVVDDPVANKVLRDAGAVTWAGATSTEF
jgi:hypothetical protein